MYMYIERDIGVCIHTPISPRRHAEDGVDFDSMDSDQGNRDTAQGQPPHAACLSLASSFGMCSDCEVLKGVSAWTTRYPLS